MAAVVAVGVGCSPHWSSGDPVSNCRITEVTVSETEPPVPVADAWHVLLAYHPNTVAWAASPAKRTDELELRVHSGHGEPSVAEYLGPDCYAEGRALHIPVRFGLDVGGGGARSDLRGVIDFFASETEAIHFVPWPEGEATLSSEWLGAACADGPGSGSTWTVRLSGTLAAAELELVSPECEGEWRGTLVVVE
ncbi:MAG: hypothetical protein FJ102_15435 [Deltaproteobacteria bacterium]|nr:hypothetical protein [Deltaproteobacteria bacterium]